ncbi:hypothetical protein, partial [Faecalibaculum rodentium]|uniref:hypothetical protein n=1 Tax=Faecalibaculum rodentium TaxID=1702221 RepID=UPI0023F396C4
EHLLCTQGVRSSILLRSTISKAVLRIYIRRFFVFARFSPFTCTPRHMASAIIARKIPHGF